MIEERQAQTGTAVHRAVTAARGALDDELAHDEPPLNRSAVDGFVRECLVWATTSSSAAPQGVTFWSRRRGTVVASR